MEGLLKLKRKRNVDSFFFFYLNFLFCMVQPINHVVKVSGKQWRNSTTHIHVSILPPKLLILKSKFLGDETSPD